MLAAQAGKILVQFATVVALSRLLRPEDFGLFALASAVVGFVEMFKEMGLSTAVVQRRDVTEEQINALFWINAAVGVVAALAVAASAPLVARMFARPDLAPIVAWLAAALAIGGVTVQPLALLRRRLRFGLLAAIDLGSRALGAGAAIALAALGGGCWALVAQPIVASASTLVAVALRGGWRPSRPAPAPGLRSLLAFGADMSGCNLLDFLCKSLDNVLIGRRWGAEALGIYARAYAVLLLPLTQLNAPLASVAVPVLSRVRHDPAAFASHFLRFLKVLVTLTTPACLATWLFAPEVVAVLLGRAWVSETAPVLRALASASLVLPLWHVCGWLFVSTGRVRPYLLVWSAALATFATAFSLGLGGGVLGVARAYAVAMWALILPTLILAERGTGVGLRRLLGVALSPLPWCAVASALLLAWPGRPEAPPAPWLRLLLGGSLLLAASALSLLGGWGGSRPERLANLARRPSRPDRHRRGAVAPTASMSYSSLGRRNAQDAHGVPLGWPESCS
jgi:PST family polysaccharide transporter